MCLFFLISHPCFKIVACTVKPRFTAMWTVQWNPVLHQCQTIFTFAFFFVCCSWFLSAAPVQLILVSLMFCFPFYKLIGGIILLITRIIGIQACLHVMHYYFINFVEGLIPMLVKHTVGILLFMKMLSLYQQQGLMGFPWAKYQMDRQTGRQILFTIYGGMWIFSFSWICFLSTPFARRGII